MVAVTLGPAVVDLDGVRAGDRNQFTATLTSAGTAINLTGKTITAQVRKKAIDTGDPVIEADIVVLDAAAGRIRVRWPGDQVTAALDGGLKWAGVWDLQVATVGEDPLTVAAGKFAAESDVTR